MTGTPARDARGDVEKRSLLRTLTNQRNHILSIVDDLDPEQLRQSTLPSGWTPLGLVRHLTLADERYWFGSIVGGAPFGWFPDGPGADWLVAADESAEDVIGAYRREIASSDEIIAATDIAEPPRQRDPQWEEWGLDFGDLRVILLHMIVETATHAGHLDAAVELMDGRQWIVMEA